MRRYDEDYKNLVERLNQAYAQNQDERTGVSDGLSL